MGFQFQGKRLKEVVCYFIKNILDRLPKLQERAITSNKISVPIAFVRRGMVFFSSTNYYCY